jgi:tyrosinase
MTHEQIVHFRGAVSGAQAIPDDRGYQSWAGIHGLPLPIDCTHHDFPELFLPWHRAYLYFFEQALQDIDSAVSWPWWDWSSERSHQIGIPSSYTEELTPEGEPNPLASSPINEQARSEFGDNAPETTSRNPADPSQLPTRDEVESLLQLTDFLDFSNELQNVHDGIHVWTGGTMGLIALAAYDPIFYAHHTMVDRLWWLWQLRHPGSLPPESLQAEALNPFRMTVAQTLSVEALGYDYASSTRHAPGG